MKSFPPPDVDASRCLLGELARCVPAVGPQRVDTPLVLYGAGNLGRMAANLLRQLDVPVEYVLDKSPPPGGMLLDRIPVIHPDRAPAAHRKTHAIAVCIATSPYTPIRQYLKECGWESVHHFYDIAEAYTDRLPMGNGWFAGKLEKRDLDRLVWLLARWEDDYSRAAHLQWLAWRVNRLEWYFPDAPVDLDGKFFIEPILSTLTGKEYFLDGGAYHGDVSERFIHLVGGAYDGITAIEPDSQNAEVLRSRAAYFSSISNNSKFEVLECALGARKETHPFYSGLDLASCLSHQGRGTVPVLTIDALARPVTFAKLHLEGAELEAIQGGLGTLCSRRPLLALTLYHDRRGLWEIPSLLMDCLTDYRFYLRLHAWGGTGCVLYGVPGERSRTARRPPIV